MVDLIYSNQMAEEAEYPGREILYRTFCSVDPLNCVLGLLVLILNSILIVHYLKNCQKLTERLFVLIAVADIVSALGHVLPSVAEILYFKYSKIGIPTLWNLNLTYRLFGLFAYCCSIHFNVILSLLRTIRIVTPFYQPNLLVLHVIMISYISLLLSLSVVDVYYFLHSVQFDDEEKFWEDMALPLAEFSFPGDSLLAMNKNLQHHLRDTIKLICLLFYYILPVTVVVICTIVLVLSVWYKNRHHDNTDTPRFIDWNHVTTTVLILSVLFFLCNGTMTVTWCVLFAFPIPDLQMMITKSYLCPLIGISISTLPLLYSLLFPLIIVCRSQGLRSDIVRIIRQVLCRNYREF